MNDKIKFDTVESARINVNNSVDTQKIYDINAIANMQQQVVTGVENGTVKENEVIKATFSTWNESSISIVYSNVETNEEMCAICTAINNFIKNVRESNKPSIINDVI